jgi:RNA polymerase sigma-70 factor (ECF subfamily)
METTDPVTDPRPMVARRRRRALPEPARPPAAPCDLPPDFEAWFRDYREPVYRYVRFRVATREVAEDITSEVFMKALRSLSRYDHRRSAPQTWLLRIAKNAVTDHLRALRRRGSLHVSLDRVPDLVSSAPSQEERLLREERLQRVFNGLSALREADQEILSLRYGAGLGNKEIAGSLGITPNAVAVRFHRALERLKAQVLEEPPRRRGTP